MQPFDGDPLPAGSGIGLRPPLLRPPANLSGGRTVLSGTSTANSVFHTGSGLHLGFNQFSRPPLLASASLEAPGAANFAPPAAGSTEESTRLRAVVPGSAPTSPQIPTATPKGQHQQSWQQIPSLSPLPLWTMGNGAGSSSRAVDASVTSHQSERVEVQEDDQRMKAEVTKLVMQDLIGSAYDANGRVLDMAGTELRKRARGKRIQSTTRIGLPVTPLGAANRGQNRFLPPSGAMAAHMNPGGTAGLPSGPRMGVNGASSEDPAASNAIQLPGDALMRRLFPDRDAREDRHEDDTILKQELVHRVLPDLVGAKYDDYGNPIEQPGLISTRSRGKRIKSDNSEKDGAAGKSVLHASFSKRVNSKTVPVSGEKL